MKAEEHNDSSKKTTAAWLRARQFPVASRWKLRLIVRALLEKECIRLWKVQGFMQFVAAV